MNQYTNSFYFKNTLIIFSGWIDCMAQAMSNSNPLSTNATDKMFNIVTRAIKSWLEERDFSRFARSDALVRRAGGRSRLLSRVTFIESFRVDLDDVERTY